MKTVKILLIILAPIVFILFSVWFILNSPYVANIPIVMSVRREYFIKNSFWIKPKLKNLPFSIIALRKGDINSKPAYLYTFLGKYKSINLKEETLTLEDKNGQNYIFDFQMVYYENDGIDQTKRIFLKVDPDDPNVELKTFQPTDIFMVYFEDTRNVNQITQSSSKISNIRSITKYIIYD